MGAGFLAGEMRSVLFGGQLLTKQVSNPRCESSRMASITQLPVLFSRDNLIMLAKGNFITRGLLSKQSALTIFNSMVETADHLIAKAKGRSDLDGRVAVWKSIKKTAESALKGLGSSKLEIADCLTPAEVKSMIEFLRIIEFPGFDGKTINLPSFKEYEEAVRDHLDEVDFEHSVIIDEIHFQNSSIIVCFEDIPRFMLSKEDQEQNRKIFDLRRDTRGEFERMPNVGSRLVISVSA